MDNKVALITDGSSQSAQKTASLLARNGFMVYVGVSTSSLQAVIKKLASENNLDIKSIKLHLQNNASINKAINKIMRETARIDLLINSHGYAILGSFEDLSLKEIDRQLRINFYATARMMEKVIPKMRMAGGGLVIIVGSIAGRMGLPLSSAYSSSQFALEGLCESIRYEVAQYNISISIIEPGILRSEPVGNYIRLSKKSLDRKSSYFKLTKKLTDSLFKMLQMGTDPQEVANTILKATQSKVHWPRYIVGNDSAMIMDSRRTMNDLEFENFIKNTILNA